MMHLPYRGVRTVRAVVLAAVLALPLMIGAAAPLAVAEGSGSGSRDQRTHFLDHARYLAGVNDADWYEQNIPFVDLPDQQIQDVYYYRWRVYKEHLRYTNPDDGYVSTEFLDCCGYAAPYQAINAAAAHHIADGRWARDRQYGDDEVAFWLTGPGSGPKPATEALNPDTTDWAHEYSFWLASAAYGRSQVTGDFSQLKRLLPELVRQYRGWDGQFDSGLGLYWSVPVWDAMEFAAPSYYTDDPYHGGDSYRATLNSYQFGDATAIASVAALTGDRKLAREYRARATALKSAMSTWLWDPQHRFFYSILREDNPTHARIPDREQVGFLPWMFGAANPAQAGAWDQLADPQGFGAPFGPTTLERRSSLFLKDAQDCCRWNGPSWPFSTAQTLTGMAELLQSGTTQNTVSTDDYVAALKTYARTQYRNGIPYVAEAHDPDTDRWLYDGPNHSEDYSHSSYVDLVLSGLLGLQAQAGDRLQLRPLIPAAWSHFAVENVAYHGRNVTVVWDRDGSVYHQGAGLRVWVDGRLTTVSPRLIPLTVPVRTTKPDPGPRLVNDAANPLRQGYPKPIASYTWRFDDPWNGIDGKIWFNEVPENTRWSDYSSPNAQDWYGVDFGAPTPVSDVRWYGYDDGGGVRAAADYRLQYLRGGDWVDVPRQSRSSATPVGNGRNQITFPAVTTSQLRLLFTNPPGAFVSLTELQAWSESSPAAQVSVGPVGAGGAVLVAGQSPVTVTVRNTSTRPLDQPRVELAVPAGWSATKTTGPRGRDAHRLRPGRTATWTFTVTPPAGQSGGTEASVVATATYRQGRSVATTHHRALVRIAYPAGPRDAVGAWSVDEGAGAVLHDRAGSHDLVISGSPPWTTDAGRPALQFGGAGQSADSTEPVLDTAGPFTVSAWVRLDRDGGFATAVSQDADGTSAFFLQYSAADQRFGFSTESGRALADSAPEVGRWYHLVGVHDANADSYTLYVDGTAQTSVSHQARGVVSTGPFAIGRALAGGNRTDWWPGAVADVSAWNRALAAAEVAQLT